MECKWERWNYQGKNDRELIDTLWNVNLTTSLAYEVQNYELIDTLWNVNYSAVDKNSHGRKN